MTSARPFVETDLTQRAVTSATERAVQELQLRGVKSGEKVYLNGWLDITTSTGTTAIVTRWREDSGITGTVVGEASSADDLTAGESVRADLLVTAVAFQDDPLYTFTVQQTNGGANGQNINRSAVMGGLAA